MDNPTWLLYGANGYTGELIARAAKARGLSPVLAGRNKEKITSLAKELGVIHRVFGLDDPANIAENLSGVQAVLNCAGPFSATARPMIEACLRARTHYLDITGEIAVFESAHMLNEHAAAAGVVICPGVGFDVVPTDCLAATLKAALPDATHLALGFDSRAPVSPGTAKTSIEGLAQGGKVRENGVIKTVPLAYQTRMIDFGRGIRLATTIPWGDVATAYYSTGIPNIVVYVPVSFRLVNRLKWLNRMRPLLGLSSVQWLIKRRIEKRVIGPSLTVRDKDKMYLWGEARNAAGTTITAHLVTPNGYTLTVLAALGVVEHLLTQPVAGGNYTPSRLMGADYVRRLPGVTDFQISGDTPAQGDS